MTAILRAAGLPTNLNRYYPQWRTIVLVRFDPGTRDQADPSLVRNEQAPKVSQRGIQLYQNQIGPHLSFLKNQSAGPLAISTFGRTLAEALNSNLADAIQSTPVDDLSRFIDFNPLHAGHKRNSYRFADELDIKTPWMDVPFDARMIRAILVLFYAGTVSPDAFSFGVPERFGSNGVNETGFLLPAVRKNLRFIGLADEFHSRHGGDGDWIEIKARDLTSVLIDTKVPSTLVRQLKPGSSILEAIASLLDTLPDAEIIRGPFYLGPADKIPEIRGESYAKICKTAKSRHQADSSGGSAPATRKGTKDEGESYWDVITDLCVSHGLIPSIDLDRLVIQPARTLYSGVPVTPGAPSITTFPTKARKQAGLTDTVRTMSWGWNVLEMGVNRKLARVKAPIVEVRSYNPDATDPAKRLLIVQHPPINAAQPTKVSANGKHFSKEIHTHIVYGIIDDKLLRLIAETIYESIGRNELGITFTTEDLSSLAVGPGDRVLPDWDPNADPDLLDLRSGDPLRLTITPTERGRGTLVSITALSDLIAKARGLASGQGVRAEFASAVSFLVARGWKETDARKLVRVLSSANIPEELRVQVVCYTFDGDAGSVSIEVELRNYVKVRADPEDISNTGGPTGQGVGQVVGGGVVT